MTRESRTISLDLTIISLIVLEADVATVEDMVQEEAVATTIVYVVGLMIEVFVNKLVN